MVISHSGHHNSLYERNEVKVNQEIIVRVTKTKYLGLNIDENLNCKDEYKKVKDKFKGGLSTRQRLKDILPHSKLALGYQARLRATCGMVTSYRVAFQIPI